MRPLPAAAFLVMALAACRKSEPPAAAPAAPSSVAAARPARTLPPVPGAALVGCASDSERASDACAKQWRCTQSLLDPAWAAIEEGSGATVYVHDGGAWQKVARVDYDEVTKKGMPDAFVARQPPIDLETHLTPREGDCDPSAATPQEAIAQFFEASRAGTPVEVTALRTSTSNANVALASVRVGRYDGFAIVTFEEGSCDAWRVDGFGFAGCPDRLPSWFPKDLAAATGVK